MVEGLPLCLLHFCRWSGFKCHPLGTANGTQADGEFPGTGGARIPLLVEAPLGAELGLPVDPQSPAAQRSPHPLRGR